MSKGERDSDAMSLHSDDPSPNNSMDKEELDSDVMFFDPDDPTLVKHTKYGVWDVYEEILRPNRILRLFSTLTMRDDVRDTFHVAPSVKRMIKDVMSTPGCLPSLSVLIGLRLVAASLPALCLWYDGQLLIMVETAVEKRTFDHASLLYIAAGRIISPIASEAVEVIAERLSSRLFYQVERMYDQKVVQAVAMLDVPTYNEMEQRLEQLHSYGVYGAIWELFCVLVQSLSTIISILSQLGVLFSIFRGHPEAAFLLLTACTRFVTRALGAYTNQSKKVAAWKSTDKDYACRQGLLSMVTRREGRKEIVAGGLARYIDQFYTKRDLAVGTKPTFIYRYLDGPLGTWASVLTSCIKHPVDALAHIYTCTHVVNSPALATFSLATLQLVNGALSTLGSDVDTLRGNVNSVSRRTNHVRRFYEVLDARNKIKDGSSPFPENKLDLSHGISVEFKNVSFSYSGNDKPVLKNISFKIEQGQLCVIVGENGSGKSTILSLISRIYDITEGAILLNGLDIRTLRLDDVRKVIAVLFQEYAIFPLTLAENIGYGDPLHAQDMDMIRQAANLGGAQDFVESLPYKFGTFVRCPVQGETWARASDDSVFSGKTINFSKVKLNDRQRDLSGGQKQRIALSRTFMKAFVRPDSPVGLLLFDEPSASLDPKAEHDLFTRLRKLRGSKTMVFSTHRFGKLTRYADIIIYVGKGEILESGNHLDLMRLNGKYAQFWNLQAEEFR